MPFYNVYVDFAISEAACDRLLANGIPPEIYPISVRVMSVSRSPEQTNFLIEAGDEEVAIEWLAAVKNAIGQVVLFDYTPPTPDPLPTPLDVWARVGTFTKSIASATTVVSSLPGTPKGIIVWGSGLSGATVGSFSDAGTIVYGFSDGTNGRALSYVCQDNVTPSNTQRGLRDDCLFFLVDPTTGTPANHVLEKAISVAFAANQFTLTWDATTLATQGLYYVFGGNDIDNVLVQTVDAGAAEPTPADVTYTGVGFPPDFGLFMTANSSSTLPSSFTSASTSISAHATNDNSRIWSSNIRAVDNATAGSSMVKYQTTNKLVTNMTLINPATIEYNAIFKGWNSDGYVLHWPNPPATAGQKICALLVKGGNWDVGSFLQPTSPNTVTTLLSGVSSAMEGVMAFSVNNTEMTSLTAGTTPAKFTIGAEDNTSSRRCLTYSSTAVTNPNPMIEAIGMFSDRFMKSITATATASSSTTQAECTVSDMATDGQFTVDFTTADSTARQVVWFSLSA